MLLLKQINNKILIFGGASREQTHFNDLIIGERLPSVFIQEGSTSDFTFSSASTSGDIPTPRSGHAVACYGKFMFLFGGIDFMEEIDYNDCYVFNTGRVVSIHRISS